MKIRTDQLTQTLNKQQFQIYVISGDEPLLIQETLEPIFAHVKKAGFDHHEKWQVDSQFDWTALLQSAQSLSLFAEQRLIELQLSSGKPGQAGGQILQTFTKAMPDHICLIITLPKLDSATQQSAWFKALEKVGLVIQIWPPSPQQLPQWIRQRLQKLNLRAKTDAIQFIAERFEGNLLACAQEIAKLPLLFNHDHEISLEDIAAISTQQNRFDVFKLTDAILTGDKKRILRILNGLYEEGIETPIILWAITREIRHLLALHYQIAIPKLWEQQRQLLQQCLKRHSVASLHQLLPRAADIDKLIKGAQPGNIKDALVMLSLEVAGYRQEFSHA